MNKIFRISKIEKMVNSKHRKVLVIQVFLNQDTKEVLNDHMVDYFEFTALTEFKKNMKVFPARVYKEAYELLGSKDFVDGQREGWFLNSNGEKLDDKYYVPQWVCVLIQAPWSVFRYFGRGSNHDISYMTGFNLYGKHEIMDDFGNVFEYDLIDHTVSDLKRYELNLKKGQIIKHVFRKVEVTDQFESDRRGTVVVYQDSEEFKKKYEGLLSEVLFYDRKYWDCWKNIFQDGDCSHHLAFARHKDHGFGFTIVNFDERSNTYGVTFFVRIRDVDRLKVIGTNEYELDGPDVTYEVPYYECTPYEDMFVPYVPDDYEFYDFDMGEIHQNEIARVKKDNGDIYIMFTQNDTYFWVYQDDLRQIFLAMSVDDEKGSFKSFGVRASKYLFASYEEAMIAFITKSLGNTKMIPAINKLLDIE